MPWRTRYGSHYHNTRGCHGADIPCGTDGLDPCHTCCDESGAMSYGMASGGIIETKNGDMEGKSEAPVPRKRHPMEDGGPRHEALKTKIGRLMAFVLRHRPSAIGISLDRHGWADVNELVTGIQRCGYQLDMPLLEEIVRTDDKQRYAFSADKTKIRANQGHSIPVDVELPKMVPPSVLYHGTATRFSDSIERKGLLPSGRLYVHLSSSETVAMDVGSRHGTPVVYRIDCDAMVRDGYEFYRSKNGVWLTDAVPPRYLRRA